MKIIGSKKTLFMKTAVIGFIVPLISFMLLFIIRHNSELRMENAAVSEAMSYSESIAKMAEVLAHDMVDDGVSLLERHIAGLENQTLAISCVNDNLVRKGIDGSGVMFFGQKDTLISPSDGPDSSLVAFYRDLPDNEKDLGIVKFQDQLYLTARSHITAAFNIEGDLVMLLPLEKIYAMVDHDDRLQGFSSSRGDRPAAPLSASLITVPVADNDGAGLGFIRVAPAPGFGDKSAIPDWEIIALALLPLLGFVLFGYLLYRYFESFAGYFETLRKILKREKQGAELFRRDHHLVRNEMPELSEIYSLVDENLNEKAQIGRVLDTVRASLALLQEKGHDEPGINAIIEIMVNFTASASGAIISIDPGDDRVKIIGRHNFEKELLADITQTSAGLLFLKTVRNRGTILAFNVEDQSDEPWRKIFQPYKHVIAIPLIFKSQFVGLLVLASIESDYTQLPEYFSGLAGELLAEIIYGVEVEKENLARQDKTKILQETSLAISSRLDLQSVLQVVASHLTIYSNATYCAILLNTDFENIVEIASFYTRRQQGVSLPESARFNISDLPRVAEAMTDKRTLILGPKEIVDFSGAERRFFRVESIKSLTILPISHSAKTIGAVVLGEERSKPRSEVNPDRLNFIQAIVSQAASAIENARLYSFINNKVDQLTALYNVSAVIHSEADIKSMLDKVLGAIRDYLHYTAAAVYIIDDKTGALRPLVFNNLNLDQGTDKIAIRASNTVSEKVAATGQSILIEDFRAEDDVRPSFPRLLSELAVPIKLGGKTIGVVSVGSQTKCAFNEMSENFLQALAAQIAVSMERARLYDQERERGLKLNTIFEFSKNLSKSLNVQDVIKNAADSIQEAFHYQLVVVFLLDRVNHRYNPAYQASSGDKRLPADFAIAEGRGLVGAAINNKNSIYIPDVHSEPDYILGIEDVKSEICIPIIAGDKVLAVLDVESMEFDGFTHEDISTLEALADIMGVAIDNSYLFEESIQKAERLSLIDNINKAISATLDLDSFFRVVARAVADNAGYRWTSLVVPDNDSFIFKAGYTPKSVGVISAEPMLEMLHSRLKSVIERSRPEFLSFSQLAELGAPERLQSIIDAGIRNLALFPIGDSTRAEAVMIVGSANTSGFTAQELQLLKDLAVHLRIAWQNAQLFKELKTAYEQLQEAQDRIVQTEKLRALGEMSSGVVHDFNNILAAIMGRLQIVSRKLDDFEEWSGRQFLQKNLDLMEKAANDGSHILSRINDFTKKKPSEKFVDVSIDQIIADTIELTRPRWQNQALAKGKSIDVTFNHNGLLKTTGSPSELREVFTNLINNAVDAINGDAKISIQTSRLSDKEIKITIEDTGMGMSAETRKRIFEPFFTTKGAGGTGLGLSVTYGIITRHKGTISVESELGRGTKFTIVIPIRVSGQSDTKQLQVNSAGQKSQNILVVDDEEGFRDVLVEILASDGHKADSAASVEIALQMLQRNNYDLIITDLGMSGLSGWEMADAVYQSYPDIRVIMATGWGANLDRDKLLRHHVNSVIAKPFKIDEILRVVGEALTRSRDEVLVD